ncbi:helix-turn-helix domain-containing protein [Rhodococcus rhodnii]|uniref:helix-turn-helix domain-containing protein n=1 Tax=Rhodococcus rhodnii TaxID=38312 RepID=UPI00187BEB35|nr:PucR family transcriptional regulator [Rhodococcus rhodnii]
MSIVTVRDLLRDAALPDMRLVGGDAGLGHEILATYATELPRPGGYVPHGALVFTTGLVLTDDASVRAFTSDCIDARAAAIGFGIEIAWEHIPPALLDAADAAGIPVLEIPPTLAFARIAELYDGLRMARQLTTERRHAVGRLLDAVRKGWASTSVLAPELHRVIRPGQDVEVVCTGPGTRPEEALGGEFPVGALDGTLVSIVPAPLGAAQRRALPEPHGTGGPVSIGYVASAIDEALAAFRLAETRGATSSGRDTATLESLIGRLRADQSAPFHHHIYLPLARYDRRHGTDVVATLRAFDAVDGSLTRAAAQLNVHPNTVRNRLDKAEALTGRSFRDTAGRVALAVALSTADGTL